MRRAEGGLIDRTRPVSFSFDGRRYEGFAGDTLASALMANGVRLLGRSFKYHRPRGVLTAGPEEPNALVTTGAGAALTPNVRATVQEVFEGLTARSQNRWPSLRLDLLGVNDALHPFLPAGFYYKTFMWPRRFWEAVYEPLIRRAAGLGALSGAADARRWETAFAHCDVLVVGGGPAGLTAALELGRAGVDVILAEQDSLFGGRLLADRLEAGGEPGSAFAARAEAELAALPNVRLMRRTTVTGAYDQGTFGAYERVAEHLEPEAEAPLGCFWRIVARRTILATGATEQIGVFGNNDLPGVLLAGAARAYANRWAVPPGRRVVVAGPPGSAARTAADLAAAGAEVVAALAADGGDGLEAGRIVAAEGRQRVARVRLEGAAGERVVEADCVAMSGGWAPNLQLAAHLGARLAFDADGRLATPIEALPFVVAGAAAGAGSTAACLASGAAAAEAALAGLGRRPGRDAGAAGRMAAADAWLERPVQPVPGRGRAFLDMQNDVTAKDLSRAALEGFGRPEHAKRYTTQGMATDQGKTSFLPALALLGGGAATTFRPPFTPVPVAAMGARGRGMGFAPEREAPAQAAQAARGAPMMVAGLWHRAAYFPRPGEATWAASAEREARMVRAAVGVTDVSTLGKIEVVGPDGAAFLDFVYAGRIGGLAAGRVRYGVMLREDGFVMDDGTVARLGPERWLLTTTTAAAGEVARHLGFVRDVLRPGLRVRFASVTDAWAQVAVTGPLAREVVAEAAPAAADLPHMGCAEADIGGVAGRAFRISFSGEAGWELAVPARFGASLWRLLVAEAEGLGGGAYGLEALNILRIEKGFLTHAEMDGRTTAADVGLGRMVKAEDHVGRAAATRPGLTEAGRQRLVGLLAEAEAPLTAGALVFSEGATRIRERIEGRVTSACDSPAVGGWIALALLAAGPERHGERVRVVDRMRGIETMARVAAPCFVDPGGERMRCG